ncbi:MFS multidrug transporter [Botrytis cinerea]
MGPIVGGAITSSYLGWRWTEYITGIMQMAVLIIGAIVLNETYPDALLVAKARRLRHDTGNWLYMLDTKSAISALERWCLAAIPVQFALARSYGPVTSELPFLALLLGTIFGGTANILNNKFYTRRFEANDNQPVPEARLPPMMIGSIFFAAGLFIFGWTSSPIFIG